MPFDTAEPAPVPGRPRLAVEAPFMAGHSLRRNYDVTPDGRFLGVVREELPPPPTEFRVVLNWFEELESRVAGS